MIPSLRGWHQQYADQGLVVIGNHYPEFNFERDINAVRESLVRLDVPYPVLQDNGRETWNSYNNRFWPALYLIDKQGRIRYRHFGEGRYEQTEQAIRDLLRETWDDADSPASPLPPGLTSTDILNVRSGPGVSFEVIGLISPGEVYQRHGEQDGWYRIRHQGSEGYVSGDYVTLNG